ncbi:ATP-binding cassette domain-containing protein, partial [Listeria monocytogenes]|nr:ATP-binding cassette domain-containing protein [Listeria monocytogenes]
GAGKSTLMNVVFGLYEPAGGESRVRGTKENINSPTKANELGIGMVHQHFMLVDKFTVAENIILGKEPSTLGVIEKKKAIEEIKEISDRYGLRVYPNAIVRDIS